MLVLPALSSSKVWLPFCFPSSKGGILRLFGYLFDLKSVAQHFIMRQKQLKKGKASKASFVKYVSNIS